MNFKLVILCVLDGWGIAPPNTGNAIALSNTPNMSRLQIMYPHTQLGASGESVGLPRGEVGNTETGHLNLGAGKIVYQDLARINMAIADGSFFQNQTLLGAFDHARRNNSNLHIMGLVGAGGVHSNIEHLFALIQLAKQQNFDRVYLHLFTDGRDSPTTAAGLYISKVREMLTKEGRGVIGTIMGRYWAMDRDQRWDRTERAYKALTTAQGNLVKTPEEAIENSYSQGKTDEFIEPSIMTDAAGAPVERVKANDAVIFFNFRIDRPRQLTKAFVLDDFAAANMDFGFDPYAVKYAKKHVVPIPVTKIPTFDRGAKIPNLYFVTMTEYSKTLNDSGVHVAFPPEIVGMPLGRVLAEHGIHQLRVSESEKERFVTFYFNGQQEIVYPGEERLIVPSPKVPTYDKKPEMSAREMTDLLLENLQKHPNYPFILINYANADMVGHTGNLSAAVTACQVVDECVGKLATFVIAHDGVLVITADHGNAEEMINIQTGEVNTEHSKNPVPFIVVAQEFQGKPQMLRSGILADVAPTVLGLFGMAEPNAMMGRNLLKEVA
jgi:2,3-bisphosphoglycerate-independent phosphoglycerate mutase